MHNFCTQSECECMLLGWIREKKMCWRQKRTKQQLKIQCEFHEVS